jgi:hypothetical protein
MIDLSQFFSKIVREFLIPPSESREKMKDLKRSIDAVAATMPGNKKGKTSLPLIPNRKENGIESGTRIHRNRTSTMRWNRRLRPGNPPAIL